MFNWYFGSDWNSMNDNLYIYLFISSSVCAVQTALEVLMFTIPGLSVSDQSILDWIGLNQTEVYQIVRAENTLSCYERNKHQHVYSWCLYYSCTVLPVPLCAVRLVTINAGRPARLQQAIRPPVGHPPLTELAIIRENWNSWQSSHRGALTWQTIHQLNNIIINLGPLRTVLFWEKWRKCSRKERSLRVDLTWGDQAYCVH